MNSHPRLAHHNDSTQTVPQSDEMMQKISDRVTRRLAQLVTERRRILYYRRVHNEELQAQEIGSQQAKAHATADVPVRGLVALEMQNAVHGFVRDVALASIADAPQSTLEATTHRPKADAEGVASQIGSAEALDDDQTSVATTSAEPDLIRLPARPKGKAGIEVTEFPCPYCQLTVSIGPSKATWKRHLLDDLEPYVCTYDNCHEPDRMFRRKSEWTQHESQHQTYFTCGEDDHDTYADVKPFMEHMIAAHNQKVESLSASGSLDIFRRVRSQPGGICVFCGCWKRSLKHHVARHLQRIASFAFPTTGGYTEPTEDQDGDSHVVQRSPPGTESLHFASSSEDSSSIHLQELQDRPADSEDLPWDTIIPAITVQDATATLAAVPSAGPLTPPNNRTTIQVASVPQQQRFSSPTEYLRPLGSIFPCVADFLTL